MSQKRFLLAVDGGGSKTEFRALDLSSGREFSHFGGATNNKNMLMGTVRDCVLSGVSAVLREMEADAAQVGALVMGMSGVDSSEDHAHYLDIARQTGVAPERIYVCNDSELAFYAMGNPPGLCAIAGTGSISTAIARGGTSARAGGWGAPLSDLGSGFWIGAWALQKLLRHCDGCEPWQPVFDVLLSQFGASDCGELPPKLAALDVPGIASAARAVLELAEAGDDACRDCALRAAALVAETAHAAYHKLGFESELCVDIVMAGSLFNSALYRKGFMDAMTALASVDNMRFRYGEACPAQGGIQLARRMLAGAQPIRNLAGRTRPAGGNQPI